MRLLLIAALLGVFFVGFPANTSPRGTLEEQPDISRSGRDFAEVCSTVGSEGAGSRGGADGEGNRDAAGVARDATCLGWVAGFAEGFLVHDELLGIPKRGPAGLRAQWRARGPNRSRDEEIPREQSGESVPRDTVHRDAGVDRGISVQSGKVGKMPGQSPAAPRASA